MASLHLQQTTAVLPGTTVVELPADYTGTGIDTTHISRRTSEWLAFQLNCPNQQTLNPTAYPMTLPLSSQPHQDSWALSATLVVSRAVLQQVRDLTAGYTTIVPPLDSVPQKIHSATQPHSCDNLSCGQASGCNSSKLYRYRNNAHQLEEQTP